MTTTLPKGRTFFFVLFAFLAIGALLLIEPFLGVIAFSMVTVFLIRPIYAWISGRRRLDGHVRLATTLTMLVAFLFLFIPLFFLAMLIVNQAAALIETIGSAEGGTYLEVMLSNLESTLQAIPLLESVALDEQQIAETLVTISLAVLGWLAGLVINLGSSLPAMIINVIIFLVLVATLLPAWDDLFAAFEGLNPLDFNLNDLYIHKATSMTMGMIRSVFVVALVQSLLMGFFFWLAGIPYAVFLATICFFLAIVPALGISFLVLPAAVILLLMGETTTTLLLLFGFYGVVSPVNRVLQPRPDRKEVYFHFALVLMAVFGGIQLFGLLGAIYGPVIMILMITTIEIYVEYFSRPAEEQALFQGANQPPAPVAGPESNGQAAELVENQVP